MATVRQILQSLLQDYVLIDDGVDLWLPAHLLEDLEAAKNRHALLDQEFAYKILHLGDAPYYIAPLPLVGYRIRLLLDRDTNRSQPVRENGFLWQKESAKLRCFHLNRQWKQQKVLVI